MVGNYNLNQFFRDIQNGNYTILSLDLQFNGFQVASLQNELISKSYTKKQLEELVEFNSGNKRWTRFNIMITSFLNYCENVDPWSIWSSCDLIFEFYSNLTNCLLNDTYPIDPLVPIFRKQTEIVIPLAIKLDNNYMILGTRKYQFLSHTSSIISKLFNSIKTYRNDNSGGNGSNDSERYDATLPEKQKILLYLVNKLNNLYFRIDSPQLCSNIFNNFKPKSMLEHFKDYNIRERIEYRYLLGRYYLLNARMSNAYAQLQKAYVMAMSINNSLQGNDDDNGNRLVWKRNINRILRYLIPAGIVIGKCPNFNDIKDYPQIDIYKKLCHNITTGNMSGLHGWLKLHEKLLRRQYVHLILLEKLPILTYRFLIKNVISKFVISEGSNKLLYELVHRAIWVSLNLSDDNGSIDNSMGKKITIYDGIHTGTLADTENILVTLINLGFLRGNCFPLLKLCVFQKNVPITDVMPSVDKRIALQFPLHSDDSWLDS
ncbi:Thp1p NDAI_0B02600 [Naumovozyma dairenensis CBS 421]|uniref:Uncharacterized protein n=1 Tax=Naumovozyma dairenensis (strain ATCC 10597 / BCRC 20456 / CBS 421 / NBRC 0211 / NRRL Y-12639) TaxID=1071378 RepID=G0W684_NAUDC|nr:hypothetical protein NDAI_0B02600 [Naumovozyma dairenensis CBS 421]CCD23295.1 hypothetical protein NDAI_0B02600 [Naumovozyma dairenensis CBS 421]